MNKKRLKIDKLNLDNLYFASLKVLFVDFNNSQRFLPEILFKNYFANCIIIYTEAL